MSQLALIIEDDPKLADIFTKVLTLAGYEPEAILDGQLAAQRIAEVEPGLIILDMHLPLLSGEEILQLIQADSRLYSTPIIVATADLFKAKSLENVVDHVMLKPVGFHKLYDVVTKLSHPAKES